MTSLTYSDILFDVYDEQKTCGDQRERPTTPGDVISGRSTGLSRKSGVEFTHHTGCWRKIYNRSILQPGMLPGDWLAISGSKKRVVGNSLLQPGIPWGRAKPFCQKSIGSSAPVMGACQ